MTPGIYKIVNSFDKKVYIGLSSKVNNRLKFHKKRLAAGNHKNEHLQRAWDKYGETSFSFEIIESCSENLLAEREKFWIAFYQCDKREFGFNKTAGGEFGRVSEEINQKRIEKLRQQTISPEQRKKISDTLSGRKQSKEVVEKRAKTNRRCSEQIELLLANEYLTTDITVKELANKHCLTFYSVRGALSRQGACK